ncbi:LAFE_0G18756g1_1 [Lachancea fermentati]|uniref:LAFE_0G18756g1_1 n=1 Tax=Lachancea fermentati TaxID=4955 RepID=A0A1G4MJ45_LACFM|nr:LAFE_0G18756g1_1 [Lachancea fermentati]
MVALKDILLGTSYFIGIVAAKYVNTSSPTTTSFSGSLSSTISSSVSSSTTASPTAFFSNVQLVDAYSGTNTSTDRSHWFMIEAELYASAGFTDRLYLTVPKELSDFPSGPFDLIQGTSVVGSISYNSPNVFSIAFSNNTEQAISTTFNFLAKLSSDAIEAIESPQAIDYTFEVSGGSSFVSTIDYIAESLSVSSTNSGSDSNGRAWFTLDIPMSEYPGSFVFGAGFPGSTAYEFDPSLTTIQVVTAVDGFNQPTKMVNITAAVDSSDESSISLSLNTQISGGKYIRIKYFTQPIADTYIESIATVKYPTLSSYKREISIIFEEYVYLKSIANLNQWGEDISVMTDSDWFSTITTTNTSSSTSTPTATSGSVTVFNITTETSATSQIETAANSTLLKSTSTPSTGFTSYPSSNTSTVLPDATSTSNSTENMTYTVITESNGAEITVYTSFFPVATLSSMSSNVSNSPTTTSSPSFNSTGVSTSTYLSKEVLTVTSNGEVTEISELIPVSTIVSATYALTSHSPSSTVSTTHLLGYSDESSTTSKSLPASLTTEVFTSSYLSSLVFTTTRDGQVSEYTTWFPVETLSSTVRTMAEPDYVQMTRSKENSLSSSATSTTSLKMTSTIITQTEGGKIIEFTSVVPCETEVSSLSHTSSKLSISSSSTELSSQAHATSATSTSSSAESETTQTNDFSSESSLPLTISTTDATTTAEESASASQSPDSSSSPVPVLSTITSVSANVIQATAAEQVSTLISVYGGSSLGTETNNTSSIIISSYDGSGNRLSGGISGIIVGFFIFLI